MLARRGISGAHNLLTLRFPRTIFRLLMASSDIEFQAVPSIGDIPAEAWDACANPAQRQA